MQIAFADALMIIKKPICTVVIRDVCLSVDEGNTLKGAAMKWAVLVKVKREWVTLVVTTDAREAVTVADTVRAMGKNVRVTLW